MTIFNFWDPPVGNIAFDGFLNRTVNLGPFLCTLGNRNGWKLISPQVHVIMMVESFGELHNLKAFQVPKPKGYCQNIVYLIKVIPQTFDEWNK